MLNIAILKSWENWVFVFLTITLAIFAMNAIFKGNAQITEGN